MKISFHGQSIYYRVYGAGRPVLLLHGFGETSEVWDGQCEWMSQYYRVILPDLPGAGKSGLLAGLSMDLMADAVSAICTNEFNHESTSEKAAAVIGHSMGGYVALAMAEKYPQSMAKLGLFHSTAYADSAARKSTREKSIGFIRDHGAPAFLESFVPNLFSNFTKEKNLQLVTDFQSSVIDYSAETLMAYHQAMLQRPDRQQVLKAFHGRVLFVIGKADGLIPYEDMLQQSYLPAISHIHLLKEAGHMAMLEDPPATQKILAEFLAAD